MILALVFQRPDKRKFLSEMSADDFLDWVDFYNRSPWGPTRDDQRFAVLLSYITAAMGGSTKNLPRLTFPYYTAPQLDEEKQLQLAIETDAALEDDGKGGYRWKGGKKPQALIDEEERLRQQEAEREAASVPRRW